MVHSFRSTSGLDKTLGPCYVLDDKIPIGALTARSANLQVSFDQCERAANL
jgi:hypothetical protein